MKTNPRLVIVKLSRNNVRQRIFDNKRKLKRKGDSISESLTKLRLAKLNEATDQHSFGNIWINGGKMIREGSSRLVKSLYN